MPDYALLEVEQVNTFPEFVAQITGYVRSASRRMYSHLIADIGAGTLDVALFTVKEESGDWLFRVHGRGVDTLGADFLDMHRRLHTKTSKRRSIKMHFENEQLAKHLNVNESLLQEIEKPFKTLVTNSYLERVKSLNVPPRLITEPIVVFICGGGGADYLYNDAMSPILDTYRSELMVIPKPERLECDFDIEENYHRYSVAYGLSHDYFDLGECIQQQLEESDDQNVSPIVAQAEWNRVNLYKS